MVWLKSSKLSHAVPHFLRASYTKNWAIASALTVALTLSTGLKAQNFAQAADDYKRGNYQLALAGFKTLAEQGNASAQSNLGVMYEEGKGVSQDYQQAMRWYRKAADQGNAFAQSNLGVMFGAGRGVAQDDRQAVMWFRKAAEQGHAQGQYALGVRYFSGRGVPKDFVQAGQWIRRAAQQEYADGQYYLGLLYLTGEGVPRDQQLAYFWFLLASAQGHENATAFRDSIESDLSSSQRGSAQASARDWKPNTAKQPVESAQPDAKKGTKPVPGRVAPASGQADSTGSGFRVARSAIVTNHHVIDGCTRLRVNGVAAQVRSSDARSDLALLNVALTGSSTSLRAQRAAVGEPVSVAGYPLRGLLSGFNMTTGNLSSLSGMGGDTRLVQITAPVQPGNSGGPVLDSSGNLMAVVVSKLDAVKAAKLTGDIPQNVNFAINGYVLRSFLDANSVDYETASSDKVLATTAIAEKAKGFTVLIECWR